MKVKYTNYHEGDFLTLNKIYPVHNNNIFKGKYKTEYYLLNDLGFLKFYNTEDFETIEK